MIKSLLSKALEERFREEDLNDCYLVDISIKPNDRITVYLDSDTPLTLARCKTVSRYLERKIEDNGWASENYALEVSSPGLDRPLKLKRQYLKNRGRRLRVKVSGGDQFEGTLADVDDETITLSLSGTKEQKISFDEIEKAIVQISFKQ